MRSPKIPTAIVCEDVRVENNGKHIIIGVYPNDIVVRKFPAVIPFKIWMQIEDLGKDREIFDFRAVINGREFISGSFEVSVSIGSQATVHLGQFPLNLEKEGELSFDVRYSVDGRWKNAVKIPVRSSSSATS